ASGKKENIKPNKVAMTTKVIPVLTHPQSSMFQSLKNDSMRLVNTPMMLLMSREAINRKLSPNIIENEISRLIISFSHPFLGLAFTFQIVLMEFWMSTKMVVDVMTNVDIPMISPMFDLFSKEIFWMASCSNFVVSGPNIP